VFAVPTLTTPTNGATGVPINQNIRITFDAPIDTATFDVDVCTSADYLDNNVCDSPEAIWGIGSLPGINFIDLVSVSISQYATSYTIVIVDARLASDTWTSIPGLPLTFSFTTENEPVRTWYFKAQSIADQGWSDADNWWSNADGTGSNPTVAPWISDDEYKNDNLALATGETLSPIIDTEVGDIIGGVSGTCTIPNITIDNNNIASGTFTGGGLVNNGFISGGTFSGNGFDNNGQINNGTFSTNGFDNNGNISGGEWSGTGNFEHQNGSFIDIEAGSTWPKRVMYFGGTVDGDWSNPGNWYNDEWLASSSGGDLPYNNIHAVVLNDVTAFDDPAIVNLLTVRNASMSIPIEVLDTANFYDGASFGLLGDDPNQVWYTTILTGEAAFHGNSINYGYIDWDSYFYDDSIHYGLAWAQVSFYDHSIHSGITASVTFYWDDSEFDGGTIAIGTKTRVYDGEDSRTFMVTRDFVADGPWTVVATGGAWVNVSGATYDNDWLNDDDTIFDLGEWSGYFVFSAPRTLYYNNYENQEVFDDSWDNILNWSSNPNEYISPSNDEFPSIFDDVVISASVMNIWEEYTPVVKNLTLHGPDVQLTLDNLVTILIHIEVTELATFDQFWFFGHPFDVNYNTLNGNALFQENSLNNGAILGNVTFENSINSGNISGNVIFRGEGTQNSGAITGNVDVYSPAENPLWGTVTGTTIYHDYVGRNLYFNNAEEDSDWNTLGNWWLNEEFTDPADSLPGMLDSVYFSGYDMATNTGEDPSIAYLYFDGNENTFALDITVSEGAYFEGYIAFTGTLAGNAVFDDDSFNNWNISASAWFYDNSFNGQDGIIWGIWYYYWENTEDMSTADGTPDHTRVYEEGDFVVTRDFVSDGPWTVTAYDAVVDITGATYDADTVFIEESDAEFIGFEEFYFNAALDNDWNTLGNWWTDEAHTVPAIRLPGIHDLVYAEVDILANSGDPAIARNMTIIGPAQFDIDMTLSNRATFIEDANFTGAIVEWSAYFYENSINNWEINGSVRFYDRSYNNSSINGSVRFYNTSYNKGTVTGRGRFYDSSYNHAEGHVINEEDSTGRFRDESINYGIVEGEFIEFEDSSKNLGEIIGNAEFDADFYNDGPIPVNLGTITGTKTFYFDGPAEHVLVNDFMDYDDWRLVAYSGVIDLTHIVVHPDTTFEELGGTFIHSEGEIYYYNDAEEDGDWNNLDNWWMDEGFTDLATVLPGQDDVVYIYASVVQNSGDIPLVRQIHVPGETATSVTIEVDVTQKAVFLGDSSFGTEGGENPAIMGSLGSDYFESLDVYFKNVSKNYGEIWGRGYFYDTSRNHGDIIFGEFSDQSANAENGSIGNILWESEFSDASFNAWSIAWQAYFYDDAYNRGTIDSGQFHENSYNHADGVILWTIEQDTTSFYGDETENYGTIEGPKYRIYQNDYEFDTYIITRDFVSDGPWIVQAYSIRVNVVDAEYDQNTVFEEYSDGVFIYTCEGLECLPEDDEEEGDEPDIVQSTWGGSGFSGRGLLTLIFDDLVTEIISPSNTNEIAKSIPDNDKPKHDIALLSAHELFNSKTPLSLYRKNNSQDVIGLQKFLNLYENAQLAVTGLHDRPTKEAVDRFQLKYADDILTPQWLLKPTWNVGVLTMLKMQSLLNNDVLNESLADRTMTAVYNNPFEVVKLQRFLNIYEWESILVHGFFDAATRAAVNRFQLRYASEILVPWWLKSPTGNVGQYTRKKINSLVASDPKVLSFE
jgi:hypothetical protein